MSQQVFDSSYYSPGYSMNNIYNNLITTQPSYQNKVMNYTYYPNQFHQVSHQNHNTISSAGMPHISTAPGVDNENMQELFNILYQRASVGDYIASFILVKSRWRLGGVLPLHHHGVSVELAGGFVFNIDFTRRGLFWSYETNPAPWSPGSISNLIDYERFPYRGSTLSIIPFLSEHKTFTYFYNCQEYSKDLLRNVGI